MRTFLSSDIGLSTRTGGLRPTHAATSSSSPLHAATGSHCLLGVPDAGNTNAPDEVPPHLRSPVMPAEESLRIGGLPLGLAHEVKLTRPVAAGRPVCWSDVAVDDTLLAVKVRREMERMFAPRSEPVPAK